MTLWKLPVEITEKKIMTIESKRGSYVVHCDFCTEFLEIEVEKFDNFLKEMRGLYWKTLKNSEGEWVNKCPVCQEKP